MVKRENSGIHTICGELQVFSSGKIDLVFKMYFLFFSFRGLVKAGHFDQGGHRVYTECENNRRVNALLSQSTVPFSKLSLCCVNE